MIDIHIPYPYTQKIYRKLNELGNFFLFSLKEHFNLLFSIEKYPATILEIGHFFITNFLGSFIIYLK